MVGSRPLKLVERPVCPLVVVVCLSVCLSIRSLLNIMLSCGTSRNPPRSERKGSRCVPSVTTHSGQQWRHPAFPQVCAAYF